MFQKCSQLCFSLVSIIFSVAISGTATPLEITPDILHELIGENLNLEKIILFVLGSPDSLAKTEFAPLIVLFNSGSQPLGS